MKMMQREASGHYAFLNSPGPLKPFDKGQTLLGQVLAYGQNLRAGKAVEPFFLVFCATEEWRIVQLLEQVQINPRPKGFETGHRSDPIRTVLDFLLQPHGLVSELVPENGDPESSIKHHRLAITNLHRS